ncbi:MAG TPA: BTAD domain-containing putative transcriptional regulator, partial [Solirubrobacterales bacterium]
LAHLVLRANRVVAADRLIAELWGDVPPPAALSTLRGYVSHLRKALGPDRLEGRSGGYVLRIDPAEVDALRFEALAAEALRLKSTDPAAAADALRDALRLWRGPAMDDLATHASLQPDIARLEEIRIAAVEERIGAELDLGRHAELVPELESLVGAHVLRERLWGLLMLALYRAGRQGDALAAYHRAREVLADELGIDPSPELQRLHEQILRQDPMLDIAGVPLRGYRLLEQVGVGTFGSVHRAFQPQVGREVAVKVIHPRLANDPEFIRRFEVEAQLVARLEHPHIVPLYDFWRDSDGAYLVMRYLRGGSLREALADGTVAPERVARLVDQVAAALAAAHHHGVVHRNVKPANVLFDEEENAYLSDFGIAKDLAGAEAAGPGGTPSPVAYYLSPEEIRGEEATPRTDIYGLGLVLYEALAGRHPFADTPPEEVIERHLREPVGGIDGLPPHVNEVIGRATAKDPAGRYPDAPVLADAFRTALLSPAAQDVHALQAEVPNPYKGLRPFLEPDAADFFGRDALLARLLERMRERVEGSRFLAVVGASGSGKSSVVRAGLIPALRTGALPGSERWFVVEMHPGAHPFEELGAALLKIAVNAPAGLAARLREGGLSRVAGELLPPDAELLVVIDQFEELFTLVEDEGLRARFLGALVAAATDPGSGVRLVVTLRADFYERPRSYTGFGDLLAARTETVTPLSVEELERAVSGPAGRVGTGVEASLVAEVVAEVAAQPVSMGDAPQSPKLLEREAQLEAIDAAIGAAGQGTGRAVLFQGAAGIGKTSLIAAAASRGALEGLQVLSARGDELERQFPWGMAIQLFAGAVVDPDSQKLMRGAAGLTAPLFEGGAPAAPGPPDLFPLHHGLHWLTANIAERSALLLLADDVHWSDPESLRFLNYLVPRLEELPASLVIAARTGDPIDPETEDLLVHLRARPEIVAHAVDPLDPDSIRSLVRSEIAEAEDAFCDAVARAVAGNPFFCRGLVVAARAEEIEPTEAGAARLRELRPEVVHDAILVRLGRLGAAAGRLVAATAVLGARATLPRAARLARLDDASAAQAADALVDADILAVGPSLS